MTFEENTDELANDIASLGFDLPQLIAARRVDYVRVERSEIEETGDATSRAVSIMRFGPWGQARGPRHHRIAVFRRGRRHPSGRSCRLFRWLKDRGVTAAITGERGEAS
jgi:circadian clock protein KaiC